MEKLSFVLIFIVTAAILIVAGISKPENADNLDYWLSAFWIIFLCFINWFTGTFILARASENGRSTLFGVMPSIHLIVFVYSIASALALIISWYTEGITSLPNWHLVFQITIATASLVIITLQLIAAKGAEMPATPVGIREKDDLLIQLTRSRQILSPQCGAKIQELSDYLRYSVPHLARLKSRDDYIKFSSLLDELQSIDADEEKARNLLTQMERHIRFC